MKKNLTKLLLANLLMGGGMLNAQAQTIFTNPVGIGVTSVSGSNYFDVDGPIRFRSLSTGTGGLTLIADGSGNLSFSSLNHLPAATNYGRFLMSDNSTPNAWVESDIIHSIGSSDPVFRIGELKTPRTIGLNRVEIWGGGLRIEPNVGLSVSVPTMTLQAGRTLYLNTTTSNHLSGFSTYDNSTNAGSLFGQDGDNALVAFDDGTNGTTPNRLVFSKILRSGSSASTGTATELMTLISNGNFGVGTNAPQNRIHLNNASFVDVYNQYTHSGSGTAVGDGLIVGIDNNSPGGEAIIQHREEGRMHFGTNSIRYMTLGLDGDFKVFQSSASSANINTIFKLHNNDDDERVYMHFANFTTSLGEADGFRLGIDENQNGVINQLEDKDIIIYTHGATAPTYNNTNERLRIKNNGKIGINTSAPVNLVDISGNAVVGAGYAGVNNAPANGLAIEGKLGVGTSNPGSTIGVSGNAAVGSGYATLTAAIPTDGLIVEGNTGIGTSVPTNKLTVSGNSSIGSSYSTTSAPNNGLIVQGEVGIGTSTIATGQSSANAILTLQGDISPSADITYYCGTSANKWADIYSQNSACNTSDIRHKTNITNLNYGLVEILKMRPVTYVWKKNDNGTRIGFIAQEMRDVVKEVVVEDSKSDFIGMRYSELIPVLVKGIQEQQHIIEQQNLRIAALETQMKEGTVQGKTPGGNSIGQQLVLNDQPQLLQNEPNPFGETTIVKYYLPANTSNAIIKVTDVNGKLINSYKLQNTGYSQVDVKAGSIAQGTFTYTLEVNGKVVDSKKMILVRD